MLCFKAYLLYSLITVFSAKTESFTNNTSISKSSDNYMSEISKKKNFLKINPLPFDNYLDSIQISYGRNRNPNVIGYGVTSPSFSYDQVKDSKENNNTAIIDNYTTLIDFDVKKT